MCTLFLRLHIVHLLLGICIHYVILIQSLHHLRHQLKNGLLFHWSFLTAKATLKGLLKAASDQLSSFTNWAHIFHNAYSLYNFNIIPLRCITVTAPRRALT